MAFILVPWFWVHTLVCIFLLKWNHIPFQREFHGFRVIFDLLHTFFSCNFPHLKKTKLSLPINLFCNIYWNRHGVIMVIFFSAFHIEYMNYLSVSQLAGKCYQCTLFIICQCLVGFCNAMIFIG